MENLKLGSAKISEDGISKERAVLVSYELENDNSENIGHITILLVNKPIRCLVLNSLQINEKFQNKGYGRFVMQKLQQIISEKDLPAILSDAIWLNNEPSNVLGMYERYGWKSLPNSYANSWLYFSDKILSDEEMLKLQKVADQV
jgi:ribosomal protein S18 acetylase RimI-like enzyme